MVLKKGGKKGKKGKNNTSIEKIKRKLLFKEDEQEYCQITKLLGNCRVEGNCCDGKTRLCIIRGGIKKKMRIVVGSVVIVSLRDFEDGKCDIIYLYDKEEIKELIKLGEIPNTINLTDDIILSEKTFDIGFDIEEEDEVDNNLEKQNKIIDIDNI
jgi:translation initiation factor 1A